MPTTKATAGRVLVTLHYLRPDNGPVPGPPAYDVYTFPCRRRTNGQAKAAAGEAALSELPANVEKMAGLLIEPPTGFDDFPYSRDEWDAYVSRLREEHEKAQQQQRE